MQVWERGLGMELERGARLDSTTLHRRRHSHSHSLGRRRVEQVRRSPPIRKRRRRALGAKRAARWRVDREHAEVLARPSPSHSTRLRES